MKPLVIRTDTNTRIGTGHVMRCLALAQAWQETGGTAYFLMASNSPTLRTRLIDEGFQVIHLDVKAGILEDAKQTAKTARDLGAEWIVVDGYQFGAGYQKTIKDRGLKLLFVDDYGHTEHYYADIVLNQNIYADPALYPNREPETELLLGTDYVLLRREFWPWRGWQRPVATPARKILVTLGGGDPDNVTLTVIRALQQAQLNIVEAIVVVGGSNPHLSTLREALDERLQTIQLVHNVTNMPELMAWADIAISAGGSTCWELAFMGLPTAVLVIADNQQAVAVGLAEAGIALNLGWFAEATIDRIALALKTLLNGDLAQRREMSRRGRQLVDGQGGQRVIRWFTEI